MSSPDFHHITIGEAGGPTYVWLHGWGQTHQSMARLAHLFERRGQHYLFDLPGFGQSANPETGAGTADYADMLSAELRKVTQGPCIFIGHSFGGRISVQMAARHPDLVQAIILIGGAGLQRKRSMAYKVRAFWLRSLGKCARACDALLKSNFRQAYAERFGSADYRAAGELRPTFVRVVNEDLVEQARLTSCPALLLYGSQDSQTPPEIGLKYATLMPDARYFELSGFGHMDILDRGAYQCQALITEFLTNVKERTP